VQYPPAINLLLIHALTLTALLYLGLQNANFLYMRTLSIVDARYSANVTSVCYRGHFSLLDLRRIADDTTVL